MAENANPAAQTVAAAARVVEEKSNSIPKDEEKGTKILKGKSFTFKHLILSSTLLSFLLSLPVLACAIWLLYMREYDCEDLLKLPQLQIAITIGLGIVFVINNLVVYFRTRFPIPGLLAVMVPLIVMFVVGLGLGGAYRTEGRTTPASPVWLKTKINEQSNWNNIKTCIYDARTCDDLFSRSYMLKGYDFNRLKLSYIEYGCCRPPAHCDMEYVNATIWKQDTGVAQSLTPYDVDCELWRNDEDILCYDCHSCKEGFRRTIQGKWRTLGNFLLAMAVLLSISHLFLFVVTMWENHGQ